MKGSLNGERGLVGVKSTLIKLRLWWSTSGVSKRRREKTKIIRVLLGYCIYLPMAVLVRRRGIIFLGKGELWTSRPFTHEPSNWVTIMGSPGERTFFYSTCQRLAGNEEQPVKEEYFLDDLHFSPPTFFFFSSILSFSLSYGGAFPFTPNILVHGEGFVSIFL